MSHLSNDLALGGLRFAVGAPGRFGTDQRPAARGDIADGDPMTFRATCMHGRAFHDDGWLDASAGKPRIRVRESANGPRRTVAAVESCPNTAATDAKRLADGDAFCVSFAPVRAVAVRIIAASAPGDHPGQSFRSCAELQAFGDGAEARP